jgi:cathepsin L
LLNAVYTKGSAAAGMDANTWTFAMYSGGVFDEPTCKSNSMNHWVNCIGWGVDGTTPYWLVRNTWGVNWGEAGYMRMIRNKNNQCGLATDAIVPADQ